MKSKLSIMLAAKRNESKKRRKENCKFSSYFLKIIAHCAIIKIVL